MPTTAESKQSATASPDGRKNGSHPRCAPSKAKIRTASLVGFEHRLKDRDRIKEKVYDKIKEFSYSAEEAVSAVSDTIRYTFQYRESRYTQGVWTDLERLKGEGFKLHKLKNSWSGEEYKGINSQWIEPDTGQRFEVQFHTRISFEAKQLTHDAYERLRTKQADEFEELVLEAFQKKGHPPRYRFRPEPPTFPTTRRETQMPDKVTYYAVVNDLSSREQPCRRVPAHLLRGRRLAR